MYLSCIPLIFHLLFVKQVEAQATFQGHTQVVGALDWAERDTIYSASWDHSLRIWDVETAVNTQTLVSLFLGFVLLGHPFSMRLVVTHL